MIPQNKVCVDYYSLLEAEIPVSAALISPRKVLRKVLNIFTDGDVSAHRSAERMAIVIEWE